MNTIGTTTARVHELYWKHVGELQVGDGSFTIVKLKDGTSYLAGVLLPDGQFQRYCLIELEPTVAGYGVRRMEVSDETRATGIVDEMIRWLRANVGRIEGA